MNLDAHLLRLLDRCNSARQLAGAGPLYADTRLNGAALDHARFLAASGYISHGGSGDSTPALRAEHAGYAWSRIGENVLARTHGDADEAFEQWWNSPGHRANLLEPAFADCGFGRVYAPRVDCWYYVMMLATPA